jgi:hypothetical protein
MAMTIRGITGAALLALLASLASPAAALAFGPTTPVMAPMPPPPTASEPQTPAQPETPPPVPPQPPLPEAPPPVAVPPPAAIPPPPPLALPPPPPPAPGPPDQTTVVAAPAPAPIWRPRLSAAVGIGGTFDSVGFNDGNAHLIPAFFTVLGIGDGLMFGGELGAFTSAASGRHPSDSPVDRLGVDAFGVFRPAARYRADDKSYETRVLHTLAGELGLGFERDGRSAHSGTRFVLRTGARIDLPLSPAEEPSEVRLRLAVRRGIGLYTPKVLNLMTGTSTDVGDSAAEVYAAVVIVF